MALKKLKKELLYFFSLVIIITWILWLPSVLHKYEYNVPNFLLFMSMFASFTPSVMGLIFLKRDDALHFKEYLKKRFSLNFHKKWLFYIPIYFMVTGGVTLGLTYWLDPGFKPEQVPPLFIAPLIFLQIFFVGGALGEEIGWRGFAYPKLKALMNPYVATLILGLIWSLWHLPLFYMVGTVQSHLPMYQFIMQNTLIAFLYLWLFEKIKGNLWLIIYLHAIGNTTSAMMPYWQSNIGRRIGFIILLTTTITLFLWKKPKFDLEAKKIA